MGNKFIQIKRIIFFLYNSELTITKTIQWVFQFRQLALTNVCRKKGPLGK